MSHIDVRRLEQAMRRVLVPTLDDGDLAIAVPAIAAEYDRLGLGRGRVTDRRLDMRLKENRPVRPGIEGSVT